MQRAFIDPGTGLPLPSSVRFPIELEPPPGFVHDDPATWPRIAGRLEWVKGRLLYMPPSGDSQLRVVASTIGILDSWAGAHPDFVPGGGEAGFLLDGSVRGADAVLVRRSELSAPSDRYLRVPPVLAVEVTGRDDTVESLREKARWYLATGARVVWIVATRERAVFVITAAGETRHELGSRLPAHPDLPGLEPDVDRFFRQLD